MMLSVIIPSLENIINMAVNAEYESRPPPVLLTLNDREQSK